MISDYRIYQFKPVEKISCLVAGMALNAVISVLFYNSLSAMIPGMVIVVLYGKEKKRQLTGKRRRRMRLELKEFLNALIAALQTGRSMENAFLEAVRDTAQYFEKETEFMKEMKQICMRLSVGQPLEELLKDFADRSHLEELEYFSEVFSISRRSGGNIVAIMKNTIRMIQEKTEAEEEIYTVIAEKQLEFSVMCGIPLAMILYLRIGAGTMLACLYGNLQGIFVMSLCLVIYGGCYLYGKRLLEIEN